MYLLEKKENKVVVVEYLEEIEWWFSINGPQRYIYIYIYTYYAADQQHMATE